MDYDIIKGNHEVKGILGEIVAAHVLKVYRAGDKEKFRKYADINRIDPKIIAFVLNHWFSIDLWNIVDGKVVLFEVKTRKYNPNNWRKFHITKQFSKFVISAKKKGIVYLFVKVSLFAGWKTSVNVYPFNLKFFNIEKSNNFFCKMNRYFR